MSCAINDCDRRVRARGLCSMHYQRAARGSANRHNPASQADQIRSRVEDLEFLAGQGVPLVEAVARVGWTSGGAMRALYRYGHPLAAAVSREARRTRRAA